MKKIEVVDDVARNEAIFDLHDALIHDGRVDGEYRLLEEDEMITAFVTIPATDAFGVPGDNQHIPVQMPPMSSFIKYRF